MSRYRTSCVTILVSSLFTEGGDWRSIYFFARQLETRGEAVAMVHVGGKRGIRQMCAATVFAPRLLVNGLGTLARWQVLMICLWRKSVRIYLHETGYALDQFQRESPLRYRLLAKILRRNPILCVSKQAEDHYRDRFGSTQTHVVYECPGEVEPPSVDPAKKHIVMVGSINERKGVELFSRVADLASDSHPDWQFHWIGNKATLQPIYQSTNVTWHGWQWNPRDLVARCDLFFLSSVDDPCPLSALEAGSMGKRMVAYRKTGIAEIIEGVAGCHVYADYTPQCAFIGLEDAIGNAASNPDEIGRTIGHVSGINAFAIAIEKAFK